MLFVLLLIFVPREMKTIKNWRKHKNGIRRAIRTFSLSVGATAVCMLSSLNFLGISSPALEASAFNGGKAFPAAASGSSKTASVQVLPLGKAFGIKLFTDGIIVASLSDVYTENGLCCPAAECGLKPGDYLLEANGRKITNNSDLAHIIGSSEGKPVSFKVRRGESVFEAQVSPVFGEGSFKTGMWVRDSAAGIGTLTFYDPASGCFAGLGHGICDMDVGNVMSLKHGEPAEITLCGIDKGERSSPGQLRGYFSSDEAMGELLENNETGVYGILSSEPRGNLIEVLPKDKVKTGPVEILASTDSGGPKRYRAEIQRISAKNQATKNLVLKITDEELLELTGGIVQGMSGAPIFQDGKLCGAVTHVFTDDPTMGYGIFAETMVNECRNAATSRAQAA